MRVKRGLWSAAIVGIAFTSLAAFQPPSSGTRALPTLSLDHLPPAMRSDFERAYRHARAGDRERRALPRSGSICRSSHANGLR